MHGENKKKHGKKKKGRHPRLDTTEPWYKSAAYVDLILNGYKMQTMNPSTTCSSPRVYLSIPGTPGKSSSIVPVEEFLIRHY